VKLLIKPQPTSASASLAAVRKLNSVSDYGLLAEQLETAIWEELKRSGYLEGY